MRQIGRLAAAELQGHRMFLGIETSRWRGTSPWISAPVVTISVYSRAWRDSRRWK
jgi:hypothetical protein